MSLLSSKALTLGSLVALVGLLVQLAFSRRVRRWTFNAVKFGAFGGCLWVLMTCLLSLFIKYLHSRVREPEKEKPSPAPDRSFPEDLRHTFQSRFESEKREGFASLVHKTFT